MTDFAALIDKAIERDLRERFVIFLGRYKHVEFGRARSLKLDEAAMILECLDHFCLNTRLIDLGVAEIAGLRRRLNRIAATPDVSEDMIANACFDALACIAALEARLCRTLDRAEVRAVRFARQGAICANDR